MSKRIDKFYGKENHAPIRWKDRIEDVEIGYPNGCEKNPSDAYVMHAEWIATGKPLTDEELDNVDIAEALEMVAWRFTSYLKKSLSSGPMKLCGRFTIATA